MSTRQWNYRGPGQKPIVVLLTDEQAVKRADQILAGLLVPLDGAEQIITAIAKELATA
jgi:hypothetical protein